MTRSRITSRATVYGVAAAVVALLLAPSWPGSDVWSATMGRGDHPRDVVAVTAMADVESVRDLQEAGDDLCLLLASADVAGLDVVVLSRLPADARPWSASRVDVRTCSLRGPPRA